MHVGQRMLSEKTSSRQNHGSNTAKSAKMKILHWSWEEMPKTVICARPVVIAKLACQPKATTTSSAREGHIVLNGDNRRARSK